MFFLQLMGLVGVFFLRCLGSEEASEVITWKETKRKFDAKNGKFHRLSSNSYVFEQNFNDFIILKSTNSSHHVFFRFLFEGRGVVSVPEAVSLWRRVATDRGWHTSDIYEYDYKQNCIKFLRCCAIFNEIFNFLIFCSQNFFEPGP